MQARTALGGVVVACMDSMATRHGGIASHKAVAHLTGMAWARHGHNMGIGTAARGTAAKCAWAWAHGAEADLAPSWARTSFNPDRRVAPGMPIHRAMPLWGSTTTFACAMCGVRPTSCVERRRGDRKSVV